VTFFNVEPEALGPGYDPKMRLKHVIVITPLLCWGDAAIASDHPCPSTPVPGVHALIQSTCRDVRQRLGKVPGASVRTKAASFVDQRFGCTRTGCVVGLAGSFLALKKEASPDSWLGDYLQAKGWSRTLSHDADGPDGTVYALHQPGALCIVEGSWNHLHEESGESHTDDAYQVTVSCGGAERTAPQPLL